MLAAAGGCVVVYVVVVALKRQVMPSHNALAESIVVFFVLAPLVGAGLYWLYRRGGLGLEGLTGAACIFMLSAACFTLTVPAIVDRSVTMYLINLLDSHPQGMSEEELRREFIEVYFNRSYGLEKRLRELEDGDRVRYEDGRYHITGRGRFTIGVARVLSRIYALDPNIVGQTQTGETDE